MNLNITCPGCGQKLTVDSAMGGQTVGCSHCSQPLIVPPLAQMEAPAERRTSLAIASLVLGILSFTSCLGVICILPAIIMGHIAHARARRSPEKYGGSGMAIAGFVTGYVGIVVMILILPAMLLPALAAAKRAAGAARNNPAAMRNSSEINSVNNLKQIGLAFRIWEGDHGDQFPFNVSQAKGGTRELSNPDSNGFEQNPAPVFMVMSNELSTPRILVCPNDPAHHMAADFSQLTSANISYELRTGAKVSDSNPDEILAVDPIYGYVLRCDGSVMKDLKYKK